MSGKILHILLCCLFFCSHVAGQESLASLLSQWKAGERLEPDTSQVSLLNDISGRYALVASDSAEIFARKALKRARELQFKKGEAAALVNLSKIHYVKGNYDLSLNNGLNSLRISEAENYTMGKANAYNVIGLIYLAQNKFGPALDEFKKAAAMNTLLNNHGRLSANFFNIGLAYQQNSRPDSSFRYLTLARDLSEKINDQYMLTMSNNRLGDYYMKQGQLKKAIAYHEMVIGNKRFQSDWENTFAYAGLAECYNKMGRHEKALVYGLEANRLARKTDAKWDYQRSARILHETYVALGDYKKAYNYLLAEKAYSDSLFNERKEKDINALYLSQKQAENQVLIKQNQLAEQKNRVIQIVILVVVLIALFLAALILVIYRSARKKNVLYKMLERKSDDIARKNRLIEEQNVSLNQLNKTKDRLFSIIGHDLRAPMAGLLGTLELIRDRDISEEDLRPMLHRFFDQVSSTSIMLENLLLWVNSQRSGLPVRLTGTTLFPLLEEVLAVFRTMAEEKDISVIHDPCDHEPVYADPDHIRIIFQNILVNAIKFTEKGGHIRISCAETEEGVSVTVRDNGVGMTPGKVAKLFGEERREISTYGTMNEKGIGIGLALVREFVDQNHAAIHIESEPGAGTEVSVTFLKYRLITGKNAAYAGA